jgi:hypothetical protein
MPAVMTSALRMPVPAHIFFLADDIHAPPFQRKENSTIGCERKQVSLRLFIYRSIKTQNWINRHL